MAVSCNWWCRIAGIKIEAVAFDCSKPTFPGDTPLSEVFLRNCFAIDMRRTGSVRIKRRNGLLKSFARC